MKYIIGKELDTNRNETEKYKRNKVLKYRNEMCIESDRNILKLKCKQINIKMKKLPTLKM